MIAVGKAALFSKFERQLPRISLSRNSVKTSGRSWQGDAGGRVADNQTPKTDIRQLPIFGKDVDETYMSEMLLEDSVQGHDSIDSVENLGSSINVLKRWWQNL